MSSRTSESSIAGEGWNSDRLCPRNPEHQRCAPQLTIRRSSSKYRNTMGTYLASAFALVAVVATLPIFTPTPTPARSVVSAGSLPYLEEECSADVILWFSGTACTDGAGCSCSFTWSATEIQDLTCPACGVFSLTLNASCNGEPTGPQSKQ